MIDLSRSLRFIYLITEQIMTSFLKYFLIVLAFFSLSFEPNLELREFKIHGFAQGTTYSISYFAKDSLVSKLKIDSVLNVIDSSMSLYKSYSTINKFNQSDKGIILDKHFLKVVKRSFEIYNDSRGLFDITVAPLVKYWGFGPRLAKKDTTTLEKILPCVGMDKIMLEGTFLKKSKECVQIDVNGIAQGYSVDVVADYFQSVGINIFLIEIGGELRISGPKPNGSLMKIGIEGPSENQFEEPIVQHIVSFKTGAITTSGNYRNYLLKDNKKISHLINPKTGYPLANEMISVTVYAKDAITADGYDNVLMAMSVNEALEFVANRKALEAYIIYRRPDGKLGDTASVGFKKLMIE